VKSETTELANSLFRLNRVDFGWLTQPFLKLFGLKIDESVKFGFDKT